MDHGVLIRQLQAELANNRTVRGSVTSAGAVSVGSGFTPARTGAGTYTVTFATAYSGEPSVTVTCEGAGAPVAKLTAVTASSFNVTTFVANTGANADAHFHFIAVGPR